MRRCHAMGHSGPDGPRTKGVINNQTSNRTTWHRIETLLLKIKWGAELGIHFLLHESEGDFE